MSLAGASRASQNACQRSGGKVKGAASSAAEVSGFFGVNGNGHTLVFGQRHRLQGAKDPMFVHAASI